MSRIVVCLLAGALLTSDAWALQSRVMHPDAGCKATPAEIEANKKVAMPGTCYEVFTFDVFRARNAKLVEHWDGAVINPPAAGGRGQ